MKSTLKIILTLSVVTVFLQVSCKKNQTSPRSVKTVPNPADISKKIALDLYRSLSSGLHKADNSKTNSTSGSLTTMDNSHACGSFTTTPTSKTVVSGDTIRTYSGNSKFTYKCYINNWNVDGYNLDDSLKTTEKGTGFDNNYNTILNYVVKGNYSGPPALEGTTTTSSYTSKVKGGVTTESHQLSTIYKLGVNIKNGAFEGIISFNTTMIDKDASTGDNLNSYSGFISIYADNTMKAHFLNKDKPGSYTVFYINLNTGEVTRLDE